jgi:preprotein translocase subunit Sec63
LSVSLEGNILGGNLKKKEPSCERESKERGTEEMKQFYQILKLKLGAKEKEIKQAYGNLVNIWHPEELSKYPYLQQIAYERRKQIELAYEKLVREYVMKKEAATPQIKDV